MKEIKYKISFVLLVMASLFFTAQNSFGQTEDSLRKTAPDPDFKNKMYDKDAALDSARAHKMYKQMHADSAKSKSRPARKQGEPFDSLEMKKPQ